MVLLQCPKQTASLSYLAFSPPPHLVLLPALGAECLTQSPSIVEACIITCTRNHRKALNTAISLNSCPGYFKKTRVNRGFLLKIAILLQDCLHTRVWGNTRALVKRGPPKIENKRNRRIFWRLIPSLPNNANIWSGRTHFTIRGLLLQYFPAIKAQTHYQFTQKTWGKICQLKCDLTHAPLLTLETDQEHCYGQRSQAGWHRAMQLQCLDSVSERSFSIYFCWCGRSASLSLPSLASTENQGSHGPASSPHHHHRVQPPGQNLRSQQLRQAPHTNVEKNLRSDWATRLKDSQIWCEPSCRFSDGVNVCRTNTKVACPHGRLLLQFQSWPQGSKSRTAENVSRGFAYKTVQITPSRPSGAEMLLFSLAPARAPYVNKAGDTPHPRETCRKTEVHFPHGAGRKVLPTVT